MPSGRIHRAPLAIAAGIALVVGVGGASGVYFAADRVEQAVERVAVEEVLQDPEANTGPAENFLILGSDSRATFNPEEESNEAGCQCSDTLMILRRDPDNGASILSLPRDLWVTLAGGHGQSKINGAYAFGPEVVIETISTEFGIPIDHYVEVDLGGFVTLIDEIGGVTICVDNLARDKQTGMELQPGCNEVTGAGALSYARSRNYEEFIDGEGWVPDNKYDLGRIERQQTFVRTTANAVIEQLIADPARLGDLANVAADVLKFDEGADLFASAEALASAAGEGIHTFTVPVERQWHSGQDALDLADGAEEILAYFRGTGPFPAIPDTVVSDSAPAT